MGKLISTIKQSISSYSLTMVVRMCINLYPQLLYEFNRVIEIDDIKDIMNKT